MFLSLQMKTIVAQTEENQDQDWIFLRVTEKLLTLILAEL